MYRFEIKNMEIQGFETGSYRNERSSKIYYRNNLANLWKTDCSHRVWHSFPHCFNSFTSSAFLTLYPTIVIYWMAGGEYNLVQVSVPAHDTNIPCTPRFTALWQAAVLSSGHR
jgi:hypothetical protein